LSTLALVVLAVLAFVVFLIVVGLSSRSSAKGDIAFPYQRRETLFSPAERSFLGVLDQAVGEKYRVFGKVRIADVAAVRGTPNQSHWQKAFNKINAKHFDFVLCNPTDLSFACAIELDDKSHAQEKRKGRDGFVEGVCVAIGLPLLRFPAKRGYTVDGIREAIANLLPPAAQIASEVEREVEFAKPTTKSSGLRST
jgi:hypothetical protein